MCYVAVSRDHAMIMLTLRPQQLHGRHLVFSRAGLGSNHLSGEISQSNSAKRELSNDVSLLEVLARKVALYTSSHLTPIEA